MLRPQGALASNTVLSPAVRPPPFPPVAAAPPPPPCLVPRRCLLSTSSGSSTSPRPSLSSSPRSAPRAVVFGTPPHVWFIRARQDAETPHVVEVQGKGHSYELHIPEHFDEACSIMEACRLQARESGGGERSHRWWWWWCREVSGVIPLIGCRCPPELRTLSQYTRRRRRSCSKQPCRFRMSSSRRPSIILRR